MASRPQPTPANYGRLLADYNMAAGWLFLLLPPAALFAWLTWRELAEPTPNLRGVWLSGIACLGFLLTSLTGITLSPQRVQLYEDGILSQRFFGEDWYPWGRITLARSLLAHTQNVTLFHVEVRADDGRTLRFSDAPGELHPAPSPLPYLTIEQLARMVFDMSRYPRYRAAIERYDRGDPVDFQKLKLSRAGVSAGWRTLPWPEVARINVERIYVAIYTADSGQPWRTFKLKGLPNADILADVAAYAERVRW